MPADEKNRIGVWVLATNSLVTKSSSLHRHARAALAAAALGAVGRERHALDVAGMGHRHHHVLALDQVFVFHVAVVLDDLGAARRGELGLDRDQLVLDDLDACGRASAGCRDSP